MSSVGKCQIRREEKAFKTASNLKASGLFKRRRCMTALKSSMNGCVGVIYKVTPGKRGAAPVGAARSNGNGRRMYVRFSA